MANELSVIENINAVEIFKAGGAERIISAIKAEVSGEVPDITTKKGRDRVASLAYKVAQSKTALDKAGKELADQLNAQLKPINAERKLIRDELDKLRDEIRQPLTDFENAEKQRVDDLKSRLNALSSCCSLADEFGNEYSSDNLYSALKSVSETPIDETWQEFAQEAATEKDKAIQWLTQAAEAKKAREDEAKRLDGMRKQAEEQERAERERRIAEDAAARAKAEAEAAAKAEQDRQARMIQEAAEREERMKREAAEAESRRIAAEEKAKKDAEEAAERARLAEIERQRQEQLKAEQERQAREADKEYRAEVNRSIVAAMISSAGITEDQAKAIVVSTAKGLIPKVSINY